ncbi:hypothetical protein GCM10027062_15680 [Nocardioides hungaricus]
MKLQPHDARPSTTPPPAPASYRQERIERGLGPMRCLKAVLTLVLVTAVVAAGAGVAAYAASRVLVGLMS